MRGLSTVDLLVLPSLDQLIFQLKILFSFFTKQATLMRRSIVLSLLPQLVFPGFKLNLIREVLLLQAGNTKGGSITVPLTSCLTDLESAV